MTTILRYDTLSPQTLLYPISGQIALLHADIQLSGQISLEEDALVFTRSREGQGLRIPDKIRLKRGDYSLLRLTKKLQSAGITLTENHLQTQDDKEIQMSHKLHLALFDGDFDDAGWINGKYSLKDLFPKHLHLTCDELNDSQQMFNGKPTKILASFPGSTFEPSYPLFFQLDRAHHAYSELTFRLLDEHGRLVQSKNIRLTVLNKQL